MPKRDGTGPTGQGAGTGGRQGNCNIPNQGRGQGRGQGQQKGGRGMGRR